MRIEKEKMWTEVKEDYPYEVMGTLRPRSNVGVMPVTRAEVRVSEEMYVVMDGIITNTPSTFEVFIRYLEYLISSGETLTSKSGIEFVVAEYHITYDHMTQKQIAEVSLISVNRIDTNSTHYKEIDKRELLTTLVQSAPH